ncbi:MAG: Flp pilus assembly protein CpaB [Acidimicrobiales bacterium]
MNRKLIGVMVAMAFAAFGTLALVAYVRGAENRALAGERLAEVYVVAAPIPAGTPGSTIADRVTVQQVPVKVRPGDAVVDLAGLSGRVSAVDLLPGEQLVDGRFVQPADLDHRGDGVQVPEEMVEVTIELEPQRAVGGLIETGQTVAVFASFPPADLDDGSVVEVDGETVPLPSATTDGVGGSTPNTTDIILNKVLITAVQGAGRSGPGAGAGEAGDDRLSTAPGGSVFVTLAVSPVDAERVVFTAEFGTLWLAIERDTVPEQDDPAQTRGSIYLDTEPVQ